MRDHDPRLALDGGTDGLDFYRRLAREAAVFLRPGGRIMLEFGDDQETAVAAAFELEKWIVESVKNLITMASQESWSRAGRIDMDGKCSNGN